METITTSALIAVAIVFGCIFIFCVICAILLLMKRHDEKVARQARIKVYEAIIHYGVTNPSSFVDTVDVRDLNCQKPGRYPWGENDGPKD